MYFQQGDVIIKKFQGKIKGDKLNHLTLAEGEATGHHHSIISGEAALYNMQGALFLKVMSDKALLKHQEHGKIEIPKGDYIVRKVMEYNHFEEEAREVID